MDNFNNDLPNTGFEKRAQELPFVFVYGTLKSTGSIRGMMSLVDDEAKAEIVGKTKTTYPDYQMMDLGAFPGVVDGGTKHIQGELYKVNEWMMAKLDMIEGVANDFYKVKKVDTDLGKGWMYYLDKEYGQDLGTNLDTRYTDRIEEIDNTLIWHN